MNTSNFATNVVFAQAFFPNCHHYLISQVIAWTTFLIHKLDRIPILICQVFFELNEPVGEMLLVEAGYSMTNFEEVGWMVLTG